MINLYRISRNISVNIFIPKTILLGFASVRINGISRLEMLSPIRVWFRSYKRNEIAFERIVIERTEKGDVSTEICDANGNIQVEF